MSRDVRMRCDRVRARFRAANNLACHGMYYTEQQSDVEVGVLDPARRRLGSAAVLLFSGW